GGRFCGLRTPRRASSRRARDEPPGSPPPPRSRAAFTPLQVSPGAPRTGPAYWSGQSPVRRRWAAAQAGIRGGGNRGRGPLGRQARGGGQELGGRRATVEAPQAVPEGGVDGQPGLGGQPDAAVGTGRPASVGIEEPIGPVQDLGGREVGPLSGAEAEWSGHGW